MTEVTQRTDFECAYIMYMDVVDNDGVLRTNVPKLNAHHYKISVTVESREQKDVIIEFSKLTSIIKRHVPDGVFLYNENSDEDAAETAIATAFKTAGLDVQGKPFVISAENLVNDIAVRLQNFLNKFNYPDVIVRKVVLQETSNSSVTWTS